MRTLIVEDQERIAWSLKEGLEQEAYAVDLCFDGDDGYRTAVAEPYDLIILDVMLPGMSGVEVCRKLREDGVDTPVLMLTAKDQNRDVVAGLDAGADDYLAKPFSFSVLLARMRALLRRPHEASPVLLEAADLKLDVATHEVRRAGEVVQLSAKEYAILEYLLRNKGRVLSKQTIMAHVWDFDADILPNTLEVFIAYLRAKIDKPFDGADLIQTVRGFGYKIDG
jgi:DNA-binding response OmpR family regulator